MSQLLRVLQIEDSESDAALILRLLKKSGYIPQSHRVETAGQLREALATQKWDVIIADDSLPQFNAMAALAIVKDTGLDIPFLVVSGVITEEDAVNLMRAGAQDYLMKDHLSRLAPALARELIEAESRAKRREAEAELTHQRDHLHKISEEVQQAYSLLQAAINSTADGILVVDRVGKVTSVNKRFFDLWHIPSKLQESRDDEKLLAHVLHQLKEPEQFLSRVNNLYNHPELESFDILEFKDGRIFERYSRPQLLGNNVVGRVWSFSDVTVRKRAEKALQTLNMELELRVADRTKELSEARHLAEAASRAKSAFLANMSHEIRTPLNAIVGTIELLASIDDQNERADMLRVVQESSQGLLRIISDVLDLSKIEAGQLDIHIEAASIQDTVSAAIQILSSGAKNKGLFLRSVFDQNLPPAIHCDPIRLKQILFNLIGNAIKFTSEGGVEVHVRVVKRIGNKIKIKIEVKDTGIGVDDDAQKRLFQPFVQSNSDTARKFGGTGLGLAISRRLAELMDGSLAMQSTLGKGTTMIILLNSTVADKKELPSEVVVSMAGTMTPVFTNQKLLIIDDNVFNREILKRQLSNIGYTVDQAQNGMEALEKWQSGDYALIITDCHMPEMDGYDLARRVREIEAETTGRSHIPIIAYTANAFTEFKEQCLSAGMDDILVKPVSIQALQEKLETWLRRDAKKVETVSDIGMPDVDPVDWKTLSQISDGDKEFEREIVKQFLVEKSDEVAQLASLLSTGETNEIARLAHRLKGAARTAGARLVGITCERIETAVKSGDRSGTIALQRILEQEFVRFKEHIEQWEIAQRKYWGEI